MWEITNNSRILFGSGKMNDVSGILVNKNKKKCFVITYDNNNAKYLELKASLESQGIQVFEYTDVISEPDTIVIEQGRDRYLEEGCDSIISFGGGSVIDAAKAMLMLVHNGGSIDDFQRQGRVIEGFDGFHIAIPTTAGTGSESTKVSVIYNKTLDTKKSIYHEDMISTYVVLDPELIVSLPSSLTAATGMDALSHAIESYVSLNANEMTKMYSLKAIQLISANLEKTVTEPQDIDARGKMLLGSCLAGYSLNAGIGIAHIVGQPIGSILHISHGDACSIYLPIAMELNRASSITGYKDIAIAMGVNPEGKTDSELASAAIKEVKRLRSAINAPEYIDKQLEGSDLTFNAMIKNIRSATAHIKCNPIEVTDEVVRKTLELSIKSEDTIKHLSR